jgi:hypothetical protein
VDGEAIALIDASFAPNVASAAVNEVAFAPLLR